MKRPESRWGKGEELEINRRQIFEPVTVASDAYARLPLTSGEAVDGPRLIVPNDRDGLHSLLYPYFCWMLSGARIWINGDDA